MKGTIAILFHEMERGRELGWYVIARVASVWRDMGYEVKHVFGTDTFVPADVALLHVDLSVVPPEYLAFADRYPVVLNRSAADIRKSSFSRNLVRRGDGWEGPVIAKSDLNCAGEPERVLQRRRFRSKSWLERRFAALRGGSGRRNATGFGSAADYRLFAARSEVPDRLFRDPQLVLERFLPEREGDHYFLRTYHFLGDRESCARLGGTEPIVTSATTTSRERIEPHPEIVAARHALGFDYGKFDYVVHDGQPVLLDINKTTALGAHERSAARTAAWRHRAEGIERYFAR